MSKARHHTGHRVGILLAAWPRHCGSALLPCAACTGLGWPGGSLGHIQHPRFMIQAEPQHLPALLDTHCHPSLLPSYWEQPPVSIGTRTNLQGTALCFPACCCHCCCCCTLTAAPSSQRGCVHRRAGQDREFPQPYARVQEPLQG